MYDVKGEMSFEYGFTYAFVVGDPQPQQWH